ncbi:MAG: PP2C family protein-serine/threonine phosphatase [Phycisphaerales bacterium]
MPDAQTPVPRNNPPSSEIRLDDDRKFASLLNQLDELAAADTPDTVIDAFLSDMRRLFRRRAFALLDVRELADDRFRLLRLLTVDGDDIASAAIIDSAGDAMESDAVASGGFLGSVASTSRSRIFTDMNVANDPVMGTHLAMYRACMAAVVTERNRPAFIVMVLSFQPDSFSVKELAPLLVRAHLLSAAIQKLEYRAQLEGREDQGQEELARLAEFRTSFSATQPPDLRGIELAVSFEPQSRSGGCLHRVYNLADVSANVRNELRWAVVMFDVESGGPIATMILAMISSILETLDHGNTSPADVMQVVNKRLAARHLTDHTISGMIAYYNPGNRSLAYALANHPPILVRRPHFRGDIEAFQLKEHAGEALGVDPERKWKTADFTLSPEDTLMFCSPGAIHAENEERETLGLERIETAFRVSSGGPKDAIERILRAVREHEGNATIQRDQALIAARIHY